MISSMKKHLALFSGDLGEKILSGEKSIESRFSKAKIAPFAQISSGDLVYIKPVGKEIIGQFRVKKVIFYDGLTKEDLEEIRKKYKSELAVDPTFWLEKEGCLYASLIFIGQTERFLTPPVKINKKDQRGWLVIE